MSQLKYQSTRSLSQHNSSTWINAQILTRNQFMKTPNLPKAHSESFPSLLPFGSGEL